jgi:hypothetical protein
VVGITVTIMDVGLMCMRIAVAEQPAVAWRTRRAAGRRTGVAVEITDEPPNLFDRK